MTVLMNHWAEKSQTFPILDIFCLRKVYDYIVDPCDDFTSNLIFCQEGCNISHNIIMKNRLIISFRPEDMFTGCRPKPIEYGKVEGKDSAVVKASPGLACIACGALLRCKDKFKILDAKLPSQVSKFSEN